MSQPHTASLPRLVISFSFGETSAYMTWRILNDHALRSQFGEVVVVVANTSREREESLQFGNRCDAYFGFNSAWVESVTYEAGRASGHRLVSYRTAARDGSVFERMIEKYGIPNAKFIHCTRELKLNPIRSYVEEGLGWERGTYQTAVGIRADEIDRMSETAMASGVIYPLVKLGIKKPHINEWWANQPFRLELKGYEGNCRGCFKKSWRKLFTLAEESPADFDWTREMEAKHGLVGGEFHKEPTVGQAPLPPGYRRNFFRGNNSTDQLFALYEEVKGTFQRAEDDAAILPEPNLFPIDLDVGGGCGESCEPWADLENWGEAA